MQFIVMSHIFLFPFLLSLGLCIGPKNLFPKDELSLDQVTKVWDNFQKRAVLTHADVIDMIDFYHSTPKTFNQNQTRNLGSTVLDIYRKAGFFSTEKNISKILLSRFAFWIENDKNDLNHVLFLPQKMHYFFNGESLVVNDKHLKVLNESSKLRNWFLKIKGIKPYNESLFMKFQGEPFKKILELKKIKKLALEDNLELQQNIVIVDNFVKDFSLETYKNETIITKRANQSAGKFIQNYKSLSKKDAENLFYSVALSPEFENHFKINADRNKGYRFSNLESVTSLYDYLNGTEISYNMELELILDDHLAALAIEYFDMKESLNYFIEKHPFTYLFSVHQYFNHWNEKYISQRDNVLFFFEECLPGYNHSFKSVHVTYNSSTGYIIH